METIKLEKRELSGKKSKRLRADGVTPCVLYDSEGNSFNVQAHQGTLEQLLANVSTSTVFEIEYDSKNKKVLVKDVDVSPITDKIQHVSFFVIDENKLQTFEIPIILKGVSPAVKNNLGVLVQPMHALTVQCKLADLIDAIEVDISKLELPGQNILVEELNIPDSIKLLHKEDAKAAAVTIAQLQKVIEEVAPVEGEGEEGEEGAEGEEKPADSENAEGEEKAAE